MLLTNTTLYTGRQNADTVFKKYSKHIQYSQLYAIFSIEDILYFRFCILVIFFLEFIFKFIQIKLPYKQHVNGYRVFIDLDPIFQLTDPIQSDPFIDMIH